MKKEIETSEDIKLLVDEFYIKVRQDALLAYVFNTIIQNNWTEHLEKMYGFWQTVLFHKVAYHGNPFAHHVNLPIQGEHFNRWLFLFTETVDEQFKGDKALEAKMRANKIAEMFQIRMKQFNGEL